MSLYELWTNIESILYKWFGFWSSHVCQFQHRWVLYQILSPWYMKILFKLLWHSFEITCCCCVFFVGDGVWRAHIILRNSCLLTARMITQKSWPCEYFPPIWSHRLNGSEIVVHITVRNGLYAICLSILSELDLSRFICRKESWSIQTLECQLWRRVCVLPLVFIHSAQLCQYMIFAK